MWMHAACAADQDMNNTRQKKGREAGRQSISVTATMCLVLPALRLKLARGAFETQSLAASQALHHNHQLNHKHAIGLQYQHSCIQSSGFGCKLRSSQRLLKNLDMPLHV